MRHSSRAALTGLLAAVFIASTALAQTGDKDAKLAKVRERALAVSEKDRKAVEPKLDATKASVDKEAAAKGDMVVAGRLATEFGMTPDALTAEKAKCNTGWGDLMIAHSLMANDKTGLTLEQMFQMRTDGMGWGQIANGMGLRLGDVVSAVKTEGNVAMGHAKADGKVATIHSGNSGSSTHMTTHGPSGSGMGAGAGKGAGGSGMHRH